MDYRIKFIDDAWIPLNQMWIIHRGHDAVTIYLGESTRQLTVEDFAAVLETIWAGWRALAEQQQDEG